MELKQDPRCYTDVCIEGKWYHYDHCGTTAYMLKVVVQKRFSSRANPAPKVS
ncbi:hypothetical protein HQK29_01545 [Vibrio vulnificus]|nr:hypothetical protein [Vibrio vulnificus]